MNYLPLPVSPRIKRMRAAYKMLPVARTKNQYEYREHRLFRNGDRWITAAFIEAWMEHQDAPTARYRRSLAEAAELRAARPVIMEDELLAGHLYIPEYHTPEEQKRYDDLCDQFARMSNLTLRDSCARIDHLSLDFDKLLKVGVQGLIDEIKAKRDALNKNDPDVYPDFDVVKKYEFYTCCLIELEEVIGLAKRYAHCAREQAAHRPSPRREELLRMAKTLDRVPAYPARDFREALQSVQFFLSTLFGLYPLNRPDRYLWKYYERDRASGTLTREEAQELIDNFCLYLSDRVFSRSACGFAVGGQLADGTLVENELTYMFLTALDHIRMPDPNGALSVNTQTSDDILAYAAEILSRGVTHPAFFNDDVIVESLMKYGCSREDAVNYIHTTCAEISVIGRTRAQTTPIYVELPPLLQKTCETCPDETAYERLWNAFAETILNSVRKDSFDYIARMLEASRNGNDPMRTSALVDDCIERGKSIQEGGEHYSFLQPIMVGFSNAVDSLLAIKKLVYEEKRLSLSRFTEIVKSNFDREEPLRQYIIHRLPHYGNDCEEADACAARLADVLRQIFEKELLPGGKMMMPGTFTYLHHAWRGSMFGASYDGRPAHFSFSDGCSPVQGRDTHGPTAMLLSMTSWDQSDFLGGMVVNIKFSPEHLTSQHTDAFISLLRGFLSRGGIEMQVNVVDRETLLDACEHPESHEDLIVRIGGYSDYFVRLSDALQREIIARTEY